MPTFRILGVASLAAVLVLLPSLPATAQTAAIEGVRSEFTAVTTAVMTAANKTPEDLLGYRPTPEVFTLRKMLLHIAGASYSICSGFTGEFGKHPKVNADAQVPKPEVVSTLTAAFAFCDAAMARATDATLGEVVTAPNGTRRPKSYYASHLLAHTGLHYGNVVTYLRMNKLSPGD